MIFNFSQFFSPSYLFSRYPGELSEKFLIAWLVVGAGLIIISILANILPGRLWAADSAWVRWYSRLGTCAFTGGLVSLMLLFFRYEKVPFLSARFWMVFWLIGVIAWLVLLIHKARTAVPSAVAMHQRQRRLAKYLP